MKLFGKNGRNVFGAVIGCASMLYAVDDIRQLDIVIRDFQPNHPDFENFSEEAVKHANNIYNYVAGTAVMNLYGYDATWLGKTAYHTTCGNKESQTGALIARDGHPKTLNPILPLYLQTASTDETLEYGECETSTVAGITQRGYKNALNTVSGFVCLNNKTYWANPVYYTPGMVQTYMRFDDPNPETGERDMYDGAHIQKLNDLCDNQFFDQWYNDVPDWNLRTNTTMDIPKDPNSNYYIYDYNYNNGGYSPLDSIDPVTKKWIQPKVCNPDIQEPDAQGVRKCTQYGPQSLSIFCPPYEYQYNKTQTDFQGANTYALCTSWLQNGGPRAVSGPMSGIVYGDGVRSTTNITPYGSAAWSAAQAHGDLGWKHLRNYAFTMMGYAKFKYRAANQIPTPEVFEFAGDDDMWIYVDGVLAVDLGGTHLSAPGSVNIQTLALNNHGCHPGEPLAGDSNCEGATDATGWADNTWHHLHFFYADRQTDGSNIYIRTSLSELAPSRYGQPAVGSVVVTVDENGNQNVSMLLNTTLDDNTLAMMQSSGQPAILVMREVENADGSKSKVVYGYYITTVQQGQNKGSSGVQYDFTGVLMDLQGNVVETGIVGNDKIAFNYPKTDGLTSDEDAAALYSEVWSQLMGWAEKMSFTVMSSSGKGVTGPPNTYEDWANTKLVANTKVASFTLDSLIERPDFTGQSSVLTQIADNNSGELPLNYTADLLIASIPAGKGRNGNPLDLTPAEKKVYSAAAPEGGSTGNQTTAFVGGNDAGASGMCYGAGDGSNESCTSIAYPVSGPFRLNVRVFDHLGHFVSQYQQVVTEEMLHKALGTETHPSGCTKPLYGETGAAWITVKMYPVSQNGRLLATGPYIYQVTFVQEETTHCLVVGATPQDNTVFYSRSSDTYRFGYKRSKHK